MRFDNFNDAAESLLQREGGYGAEARIIWEKLSNEITNNFHLMPDSSAHRSDGEIRADEMISEQARAVEIRSKAITAYHFKSLKANYSGNPNCDWMLGVQRDGCWLRLGHKSPISCFEGFEDAIEFNINVIESELYPEGVAVVVALVPNDGTRKPMQTPKKIYKRNVIVDINDLTALSGRTMIDEKAMIKAGLFDEAPVGKYNHIGVSIAADPDELCEYIIDNVIQDIRILRVHRLTKEARQVANILGLRIEAAKFPQHRKPYENTNIDVGYFKLPANYSDWTTYIKAINSAYSAYSKSGGEGFGTSADEVLETEVEHPSGISNQGMIDAIRATEPDESVPKFQAIRDRRSSVAKFLQDKQDAELAATEWEIVNAHELEDVIEVGDVDSDEVSFDPEIMERMDDEYVDMDDDQYSDW